MFGDIVAFNCTDLFSALKSIVALLGDIDIDTGDVCTVTLADVTFLFSVTTVITVVPFFTPVTTPSLFTVATLLSELLHVNPISVLAVLGYIVALNWYVLFVLISNVTFSLSNPIDNGVDITVTFQVAVFPFSVVAVIVTSPFEIPVTNPFSSTTAISLLLLVHFIPVL